MATPNTHYGAAAIAQMLTVPGISILSVWAV
jgi:hypothetical protein